MNDTKRCSTCNKLRWYPQQPQRCIFINLSEACCEGKHWKHTEAPKPPRPSPEPSPEPCWTWPGSAPKPPRPSPEPSPRPSPEPSPEPCWTWLGFAPRLPGTFSGSFSRTLLKPPRPSPELSLHQTPGPSPEPSTEPVEPDLALHQGFLEPSSKFSEPCWTWPGCTKASQTFSGTFARTLLNLTWLCTKASQTFTGTFSGTLLNLTWLHQSLPDLRRNLLRNLLRNPVEPDLALHQSLPGLLQNLRNLLRNLVEPDPAPAPVHTGAILGWRPHSLSLLGKKTKDLFSYGFKCCDKCTEYRRRRAEEEEMVRPTTIRDICNMRVKQFGWKENISAK